MNTDTREHIAQGDRHLTRADVERLLQQAGSSEQLVLNHRNLQGIDLTGLRLAGIYLAGANLHAAKLRDVDLTGAHLQGADLSFADLTGADLRRADFRSGPRIVPVPDRDRSEQAIALVPTDLQGANLSRANLSEAQLSGVDLSEVDLTGAILEGAHLDVLAETRAGRSGGERHTSDRAKRGGIRQALMSRSRWRKLPGRALAVDIPPTFRIRLVEEPLTPPHLLSALSVVTELATKCWLIAQGRFADLVQYAQTHEVRFTEESHLHFTSITYNSPFDASFKIDLSASNVAEGIVTALDGITQIKQKLRRAELENEAKAQAIAEAKQKAEREEQSALIELERQALAVERERLDLVAQKLDLQKKAIEYALEVAARTVTVLRPDADEQVRSMLIQTLLPTLLQASNIQELQLVLPPGSPDEAQQKEQLK